MLPDRTLCWVQGPPWDRYCEPVEESDADVDVEELRETLREAVRIIARRENRQRSREGQDFLIRARRVLT